MNADIEKYIRMGYTKHQAINMVSKPKRGMRTKTSKNKAGSKKRK